MCSQSNYGGDYGESTAVSATTRQSIVPARGSSQGYRLIIVRIRYDIHDVKSLTIAVQYRRGHLRLRPESHSTSPLYYPLFYCYYQSGCRHPNRLPAVNFDCR